MSNIKWSYKPYIEFRNRFERNLKIVSIRPANTSFSFEIFDTVPCDFKYKVFYRVKGTDDWNSKYINREGGCVEGLESNTEYEFYVKSINDFDSEVRLVKTGIPNCTSIVNYLHPDDKAYSFTGSYLGSPSIVRLKSGKLLASHDYFGNNGPMSVTSIFESNDNAKTWTYTCDLMPCAWSYLFTLNDKLYMLGISREYGDILIGESNDDGRTWNNPTVIERGLGNGKCGFHRAPCKHVVHNNRIWFTVENGAWNDGGFAQCLISAPIDTNLLDAGNWSITKPFFITSIIDKPTSQVIEGTPFIGKDNKLYVLYRYEVNCGILLEADANRPQDKLKYISNVNLPCAHTKFELVLSSNGTLYAIGNDSIENTHIRNILSLFKSTDGMNWEKVKTIVDALCYDRYECGFQYPSFILEENHLTLMTRTAFNGAHNYHDSNMMLIYKFDI